MNNKCMFLDGYSCQEECKYDCHVWIYNTWKNRSLCEIHADFYMKANISSNYPAFAVKLKECK